MIIAGICVSRSRTKYASIWNNFIWEKVPGGIIQLKLQKCYKSLKIVKIINGSIIPVYIFHIFLPHKLYRFDYSCFSVLSKTKVLPTLSAPFSCSWNNIIFSILPFSREIQRRRFIVWTQGIDWRTVKEWCRVEKLCWNRKKWFKERRETW